MRFLWRCGLQLSVLGWVSLRGFDLLNTCLLPGADEDCEPAELHVPWQSCDAACPTALWEGALCLSGSQGNKDVPICHFTVGISLAVCLLSPRHVSLPLIGRWRCAVTWGVALEALRRSPREWDAAMTSQWLCSGRRSLLVQSSAMAPSISAHKHSDVSCLDRIQDRTGCF